MYQSQLQVLTVLVIMVSRTQIWLLKLKWMLPNWWPVFYGKKKNATKHLILTLDQLNLAKPRQSVVSPYTKARQKAKKI